MDNKLGWYFPRNLGGQEEGFENQGINQFKVSPYGKLAREVIQNSYDARVKDEDNSKFKRVRVEFKLSRLPKNKLLDLEYVGECINESRNYFPNNSRLKKFSETADEKASQEYIDVLKISDYNTTGLIGIDKRDGSYWYGLTKSSGNSTKQGVTGGSYGAGKHAPFVFSHFRTLYYGTFVETEGFAFLGKSILCSHKKENALKCNIGYYGEVLNESCMPIRDANKVDEYYRRSVPGTDLYIIGARLENDYWMANIMLSVLENFWKLIIEDKLEVVVSDDNKTKIMNSKNVREYAQKAKKDKAKIDGKDSVDAYKFIEVYDSDIEHIYGSICEPNDVKLKILKIPEYAEKKILKMRNTEMKINVFSPKKRPIDFIGILEATGEKLDSMLRDSEPQTHDEWNSDNIENDEYRKLVRGKINNLNSWINDQINNLTYYDDSAEFDAEGLDSLAIDEDDDGDLDEIQRAFDDIVNKEDIEESEILVNTSLSDLMGKKVKHNSEEGNIGLNSGENEKLREEKSKSKENGVNFSGEGSSYREIEISYIKTPYDCLNKVQKLILRASEKFSNCRLDLYKLTDSGELEILEIESAKIGNKKLRINSNKIDNFILDNMNNTVIDIKLKEIEKCIMEVKAYVQD